MRLLVKRALDDAAVWHQSQQRKYPHVAVPYISHSAGVVFILGRHQFDDEVVAAGALHDVIEDCGVTYEKLEGIFGMRVAELVRAVSEEDKTLSWEVRKADYLDRIAQSSWDAQAIAVADKIDNFLSIAVCARDHGNPWTMFRRGRAAQLAHFSAFMRIAESVRPHALIDELRDAFGEVETIEG
jgi:(p)ppGpp synthase/HD superfamily hydrolase